MRTTAAWLSAAVLAFSACADSAVSITEATYASSLGVDLSTMTVTATGLYYKDVVVGTGATAGNGQLASVHYVGRLTDATQFDANSPPSPPFSFRLGTGAVIAGWDQGVPGMRVGGRRQLIIPPTLGYGSRGQGSIPGNAILVFTVDLVAVQ